MYETESRKTLVSMPHDLTAFERLGGHICGWHCWWVEGFY